jgi:hypothetical protein
MLFDIRIFMKMTDDDRKTPLADPRPIRLSITCNRRVPHSMSPHLTQHHYNFIV